MAVGYKLPRGIRANLTTKVSGATIVPGQLYYITDEARITLGTATNVIVDLAKRSDDYHDVTNASPGLPATGAVRIYPTSSGGRGMLRVVGADGDYYTTQPHMGKNNNAGLNPQFGTTTADTYGWNISVMGTTAARSWASTSRFTRTRRIGIASSASAGSFTGYRGAAAQASVGDSTSLAGGFHFIVRFGVSDASLVSSTKMFVGMAPPGTPTNAEVSTLTNSVGIGKISTSSNLCLVCSGSTAQAVVDLGTSYPIDATNTDFYEFSVFSPAGSSALTWTLTRFLSNGTQTNTSGTYTTTSTTVSPGPTVGLTPTVWRMTPTTTAVSLDVAGMYLETDI